MHIGLDRLDAEAAGLQTAEQGKVNVPSARTMYLPVSCGSSTTVIARTSLGPTM